MLQCNTSFKALGCCNPALLLGPGVLLSPRTHRRASFFLSFFPALKQKGAKKKRAQKKKGAKNRPSYKKGCARSSNPSGAAILATGTSSDYSHCSMKPKATSIMHNSTRQNVSSPSHKTPRIELKVGPERISASHTAAGSQNRSLNNYEYRSSIQYYSHVRC